MGYAILGVCLWDWSDYKDGFDGDGDEIELLWRRSITGDNPPPLLTSVFGSEPFLSGGQWQNTGGDWRSFTAGCIHIIVLSPSILHNIRPHRCHLVLRDDGGFSQWR